MSPLYRVWHGGETRAQCFYLHYSTLIRPDGSGFRNNREYSPTFTRADVDLCSGVRDVKGRWVYEGDILRVCRLRHLTGVVIFRRGIFQIVYLDDYPDNIPKLPGDIETLGNLEKENIRIIGNIRENPEIIERIK